MAENIIRSKSSIFWDYNKPGQARKIQPGSFKLTKQCEIQLIKNGFLCIFNHLTDTVNPFLSHLVKILSTN